MPRARKRKGNWVRRDPRYSGIVCMHTAFGDPHDILIMSNWCGKPAVIVDRTFTLRAFAYCEEHAALHKHDLT